MVLKVAIVGCGRIADNHVEEIRKMKNACVVAACDLELLMAEQLAVRYQIPKHYDDYGRMLEVEQPDVVHITTPPQAHLALATKAIERGCNVFVEKPITPNCREAEQLIGAVQSAGLKLTVGHTYVFDPPAIAMRELVRAGLLGDPIHVESFYGYDLGGIFGKAVRDNESHWVHKLPGKLFQNNLDHVLNKITEFVPDEEPSVFAAGYRRAEQRYGDTRDELLDELRVMVLGRKTSGYATFSCHSKPVGHFARVYGTKNTIHVDYISRTITFDVGPKLPSAIGRLLPPFSHSWGFFREGCKNVFRFTRSEFHFFAGLHSLIASFYESVITDSAPPIPYRDILRIARMMDRINDQVGTSTPGKRE